MSVSVCETDHTTTDGRTTVALCPFSVRTPSPSVWSSVARSSSASRRRSAHAPSSSRFHLRIGSLGHSYFQSSASGHCRSYYLCAWCCLTYRLSPLFSCTCFRRLRPGRLFVRPVFVFADTEAITALPSPPPPPLPPPISATTIDCRYHRPPLPEQQYYNSGQRVSNDVPEYDNVVYRCYFVIFIIVAALEFKSGNNLIKCH